MTLVTFLSDTNIIHANINNNSLLSVRHNHTHRLLRYVTKSNDVRDPPRPNDRFYASITSISTGHERKCNPHASSVRYFSYYLQPNMAN